MIDIKTELQDYKKINLDEIEAGGQQLTDDTRNSILLYNKAVESLSNGSEDMAIIELKKAVSMNPHFYEALNLLGICYGYINDNEKAADIFDRVIKGENNGVKAQKYLGMIKSPDQAAAKSKAEKRSTAANVNNTNANSVNQSSTNVSSTNTPRRAVVKTPSIQEKRLNIFKYAACFAAGAILVGIISLASHKPDVKVPDTSSVDASSTTQIQLQTDDYKLKNEELDNNYKLLQKDADKANKMVEYYKNVIKLYDVESLVAGKQVENAADLLIQLKSVEYTGADSDKFKKLSSSLLPKAAWAVYEDGIKLFNSRKYEESLKKLDKVQIYEPTFSRNDSVLYYQGKCYQQLNDSRNAITAFQKLIDTYPQSTHVKYAKSKIERLIGQP